MKTTFYTSIAAIACHLATYSQALEIESSVSAPSPDIPASDLVFSKKRCPAKMLAKSKRNLCDDCSTSEIDGTCSVSYLKDVPKAERKYEKACRCNPNEFAFNKKELNP